VKKTVHLQPIISKTLLKTYQSGHIGSAYLFAGPRGSGKEGIAAEFASLLNCEQPNEKGRCEKCSSCIRSNILQHENIKFVVPLPTPTKDKTSKDPLKGLKTEELKYFTESLQKKAKDPFFKIRVPRATRILLTSVQELRKTLYLKTLNSGRKVVLIFDSHLLSAGQGESANALLKILEEPPKNTTLILVTDHKPELLPTILSRCQHVDFPPITTRAIVNELTSRNIENERAEFIAGLAEGDMHRALALSDQSMNDIHELIKYLAGVVLSNDGKTWRKFVNDYSQMARFKPEKFNFHFYLLQLWFRSAYRLRNGIADDLHTNDLSQMMTKLSEKFPNADLTKIDMRIEHLLLSGGKNLFMPLALTNLLIEIQNNLNGKNHVRN